MPHPRLSPDIIEAAVARCLSGNETLRAVAASVGMKENALRYHVKGGKTIPRTIREQAHTVQHADHLHDQARSQ